MKFRTSIYRFPSKPIIEHRKTWYRSNANHCPDGILIDFTLQNLVVGPTSRETQQQQLFVFFQGIFVHSVLTEFLLVKSFSNLRPQEFFTPMEGLIFLLNGRVAGCFAQLKDGWNFTAVVPGGPEVQASACPDAVAMKSHKSKRYRRWWSIMNR